MSLFKPTPNILLTLIITLLLTAYQLARIIVFVAVYGGLEHDGGWMLSVSRSLAEQGTYTTMVSTIVEPDVPAGINVDQKFDIQAADGRIWFFTGNGVGPASIIPDAAILKLFGTGFWALHLGPLLFYTCFLFLAAYSLYRLAGLGAVILFHAFLFFYPHLSIFLGYEAMGEVPGMVYILAAYLLFAAAMHSRRPRRLSLLIAGFVAGLALAAKLITLWSISGIFIWAGLIWLMGLKSGTSPEAPGPARKFSFNELLWLGGGTLAPLVLWELVHLIVLTRLAGFELYLRHAGQRIRFILDDGSGVGLRTHAGAEFFWDKFFLLTEIAHPQRWVTGLIFLALLLGGILLLWVWRSRSEAQTLFAPLWLGWLMNTIWFASLAKTGWPRHFWFGLILAMMALCVIAMAWLQSGIERLAATKRPAEASTPAKDLRFTLALRAGQPFPKGLTWYILRFMFYGLLPATLLALIGWGFIDQPHVRGFFLPHEIVPYWREKHLANKYGAGLPWIITPRAAQAEVVAYLQQLPPEAHIYYPAQHKAAEISAQVGRVLYPLNRRKLMQPHPLDVALVSPTLIAPWMDPVRQTALLDLVQKDCPQPILKNDYYMICPLPPE